MNGYNGWANYPTWNVALWLQNDEGLYSIMREHRYRGYKSLTEDLRELGCIETPYGIAYNDSGLDIDALEEMMQEA